MKELHFYFTDYLRRTEYRRRVCDKLRNIKEPTLVMMHEVLGGLNITGSSQRLNNFLALQRARPQEICLVVSRVGQTLPSEEPNRVECIK